MIQGRLKSIHTRDMETEARFFRRKHLDKIKWLIQSAKKKKRHIKCDQENYSI